MHQWRMQHAFKQPKLEYFSFICRELESCNQTALALQFEQDLEVPSQILDDWFAAKRRETLHLSLVCCARKAAISFY